METDKGTVTDIKNAGGGHKYFNMSKYTQKVSSDSGERKSIMTLGK